MGRGQIRDRSCIWTYSYGKVGGQRDAVQGMGNGGFSELSNQTTGPPSLLPYHRPNGLVLRLLPISTLDTLFLFLKFRCPFHLLVSPQSVAAQPGE